MTAAERVLGLLPQLYANPASDAVLAALITAWCWGLERPADVAYGTDLAPRTWDALSNPAVAPTWALPHAAQYTGGTMPVRLAGESDTDYYARARAAVVRPRGMLRGAYSALVSALQAHLTGAKFVSIVEWVDDSPWMLAARVRADEAPDIGLLAEVANAPDAVPAGMRVEIVTSTGVVWDEVAGAWDDTATTWDAT